MHGSENVLCMTEKLPQVTTERERYRKFSSISLPLLTVEENGISDISVHGLRTEDGRRVNGGLVLRAISNVDDDSFCDGNCSNELKGTSRHAKGTRTNKVLTAKMRA